MHPDPMNHHQAPLHPSWITEGGGRPYREYHTVPAAEVVTGLSEIDE